MPRQYSLRGYPAPFVLNDAGLRQEGLRGGLVVQETAGGVTYSADAQISGAGGMLADATVPVAGVARVGAARIDGVSGRVNLYRNVRGEGGTPGIIGSTAVLPTNMAVGVPAGLVGEYLGQFYVDGIPYSRFKFSGTTADAGSPTINPISGTSIGGIQYGTIPVQSLYWRLVAGSTAGINTFRNWGIAYDSLSAGITTPANPLTVPSATTVRVSAAYNIFTTGRPPYMFTACGLIFPTNGAGSVIDITLDIGGWQLELLSVSSLIMPPVGVPGATARGVEVTGARLTATAASTIPGFGGRINYIQNVRGEGGTVGTIGAGGVLPSFYQANVPSPLTLEYLGQIDADGIPLTRWRYSGTTTGLGALGINPWRAGPLVSGIPNGATHTESFWVRLVAGTTNGIDTFRIFGSVYDKDGVGVFSPSNTFNITSTLTRIVANNWAYGTNGPYAVHAVGTVFYPFSGQAIDITFDIGGWQFEILTTATSLILPPVGAPAQSRRGIELRSGVSVLMPAETTIDGTAVVLADGEKRIDGAALIAGVGGVRVTGSVAVGVAAQINGAGSVRATASIARPAAAQINGAGSLRADTTVQGQQVGAALIDGAGSLRATATVLAQTASTIAGLGGETNFVRNPLAEGAGAGTPGTAPTHWSILLDGQISRQIVGTGVENGLPYLDVRFFGTKTIAGGLALQVLFDGSASQSPTRPGDVWANSFYCTLVGGSMANILLYNSIVWVNSVGTNIGAPNQNFVPPSGDLRAARNVLIPPAAPDQVRGISNPAILATVTLNQPVNVTIRVSSPQLELGSLATSVIYPPVGIPAVTTRAIEALPSVSFPIAARLDGVGSLGATAAVRTPASALITGSGSLRADAHDVALASARIAGTGGLESDALASGQGYAGIDGEGTLNTVEANTRQVRAVQARLAGAGSLRATTLVRADADAQLNGVGGVRADGFRAVPANVRIDGAGDIDLVATKRTMASARIDGTGDVDATDTTISRASARINGAGDVDASAIVVADTDARIAGVGSVRADTVVRRAASSLIAGVGGVYADAIQRGTASARIDGNGQVRATAAVVQGAQARINGLASLRVNGTIRTDWQASSRIAGAGLFRAQARGDFPAGARIDGRGGKTNWIFNSRAEGAVFGDLGFGGVLPVGWLFPSRMSGLAWSLLGEGIENGIPYIDIRWSGITNDVVIDLTFAQNQEIPASRFENWSVSAYIKVLAGSTTGITFNLNPQQMDANGNYLREIFSPILPPGASTPLDQARCFTVSMLDDPRGIVYTRPVMLMRWATGLSVDITLRIGGIQAERISTTPAILPLAGGRGPIERAIQVQAGVAKPAAARIAGAGSVRSNETPIYLGATKIQAENISLAWNPSYTYKAETAFSDDNRTYLLSTYASGALFGDYDAAGGNLAYSSGKLYAEFTPHGDFTDIAFAFGGGIGLQIEYTDLIYSTLFAVDSCMLWAGTDGGGVWLQSVDTGVLTNAWTVETVSIAVDLDNKRIWFRLLPGGTWNGNGSDPTIPSTGIDISSVFGPGVRAQFASSAAAASSGGTINGGTVAFQGTMPTGYTGWPVFLGGGNVQARAAVAVAAAARIGGQGNLATTTRQTSLVAAQINGRSTISVDGLMVGQEPGASRMAGEGNVQFTPAYQLQAARARLSGTGSVEADADYGLRAAVRILGRGSVYAPGSALYRVGAKLHGSGGVDANGIRAQFASVRIGGIGSFRSIAKPARDADATIAGQGTIRATAIVKFAQQAAAWIAGAGSLRASATKRATVAARLAGTGAVMAQGRRQTPAAARVGGTGSLAATAAVRAAARARVDGLGLLRTINLLTRRLVPALARIGGAGQLKADAHSRVQAVARINGTGTLRATGSEREVAVARISGQGAVRATGSRVWPIAAKIQGQGAVRVTARVIWHAQARIAGAGLVRASGRLRALAWSWIAGVGRVQASAFRLPKFTTARIGGQGAVRATAGVVWHTRATIAGRGSVQAPGRLLGLARGLIAGIGRLRVAARLILPVRARLPGVGHIETDPEQRYKNPANAKIQGIGHVAVDPYVDRDRVALLGVHLPPTARGVSIPPQPPGDQPVMLPPTKRSAVL